MASMHICEVRKSFGETDVLHGISVEIDDGSFVVLVGPSGCGKSTLLRIVAGLEEISGGEVKLGERVLNKLRPKDRDIAMVFQNYALYPHMTVAENMSFALQLQGVAKDVIEAKANQAAETLGLGALLSRYPRELSGGQRQRVAMGRAIVRAPQVFLFDEPLSNLDAKLRVQMRAEIKELHQRLRTTTIYVTHDQIEAMTMADKIVVMNQGRIEQMGTPLELYDRPQNLFVAGFLGSPAMNLLSGAVDMRGTPAFVTEKGLHIPLPKLDRESAERIKTAGFRPEHMTVDPEGIDSEVVVVEPTGLDTMLVLDMHGEQVVAIFRDRLSVRPGDHLAVKVGRDMLHLFDGDGGRRVEYPGHGDASL